MPAGSSPRDPDSFGAKGFMSSLFGYLQKLAHLGSRILIWCFGLGLDFDRLPRLFMRNM